MRRLLPLLLAVLLVSCAEPGPDLILYNGSFWTGSDEQPRASAVAISGGVFEAVGSDNDIRALAGA